MNMALKLSRAELEILIDAVDNSFEIYTEEKRTKLLHSILKKATKIYNN